MNFTYEHLLLYFTISALGTVAALYINVDDEYTLFDVFVLAIHYFSVIFTIMFLVNVAFYGLLT